MNRDEEQGVDGYLARMGEVKFLAVREGINGGESTFAFASPCSE